MKSKNLKAIVLSRKDFGEADRLLSLFTLDEGRVSVLAKGSRKIKSKMASHIEPFTVVNMQVVEGKTFNILTGAETVSSHESIIKEIGLYKNASYLCEVVRLAFQDGEGSAVVYDTLRESLELLPSLNEADTEMLKRYFEFKVLSEIGYSPDYNKCAECHKELVEEEKYTGGFEGFLCSNCEGSGEEISKNALKLLRIFRTKTLKEALAVKAPQAQQAELKEVIYSYLCGILPRIPKSEDF